MENIEHLLKRHLQNKESGCAVLPSPDCPSELELSDYLESRLSKEKEDLLLEHIADCPHCLSLLELAQASAKEKGKDKPSAEMIRRAKDIIQKRPGKKTLFNYKWQILAALAFILSFIFTRYFLQFLILAVVFSLKWIFEAGSTRTLIMIYHAWRKKDHGSAKRIIQDFQDKIEQRR